MINLHPDARPIIEHFITNGAKSYDKIGEISQVRQVYKTNSLLAEMSHLESVQTLNIQDQYLGEPIDLRIYDAQIKQACLRPTVLFIHGGGWVLGSLDSHDSICRKIAATAKVRVISVNYRLSPEVKFPVPYMDCQNALAYLMMDAARLQVDIQRLIFMGDSAGANLVAHLGQNFYSKYEIVLKAQVLIYPVIGYFPEQASYQSYQDGFPLVGSTVHWFFDQLFNESDDRESISLLSQPFDARNGDIYLISLEHDPLRDEVLLYLAKAIQNGLNVEYRHLNGLMHGIFTLAGKLPIAEQYLNKISNYISSKI